MDTSHTFSTAKGVRAMIYAPPDYDPPAQLELVHDGEPVTFIRVSDQSLVCGAVGTRITPQGEIVSVPGECRSAECHRAVLGECQCGRHSAPVRYTRAA